MLLITKFKSCPILIVIILLIPLALHAQKPIEDWYDLDSIRYNPTADYELKNDLTQNTDGYEAFMESQNMTKEWQYKPDGHRGNVSDVTIGDDGYIYTVSSDRQVNKSDSSGSRIWAYTGHSGTHIWCIAVDDTGNTYSGSWNGELHKTDSNGNKIWIYLEHNSGVNDVAIGDDGFIYTASSDDEVHKIDPAGNKIWYYDGHSNNVRSVAVDEHGYIYTAGSDHEIHKIDSAGNHIWSYTGHSGGILDLTTDENGNIFSASSDQTLSKIDSGGNVVWSYSGHTDWVNGVDVNENGQVYSVSRDEEVHKLDSTGNYIWSYTGHSNPVRSVAVDDHGYVYTASNDHQVHKLDPAGNQIWKSVGSKFKDVVVDEDRYIYTASGSDNKVQKVSPSGKKVWSYTGHDDRVRGVAVDNDGYVYSASSDNEIHKIDSSGSFVWAYTEHSDEVAAVTVDQNGYVYSASSDGGVHKITPNGQKVWSYTGHWASYIRDVAVDKNGFVYSGSSDDGIHKTDPNGSNVWSYDAFSGTLGVMAVTVANDTDIYIGTNVTLEVIKLDSSGNVSWEYDGHDYSVYGLAVDENGNIYSGSTDNELHKLDPEGEKIGAYKNHIDRVSEVSIDDDGFVYTVSEDGSLHKIRQFGCFEPISGFEGTLDGQGFTIHDLCIGSGSGQDDIGLFDTLHSSATVTNLEMENVQVSIADNHGERHAALAGTNKGTIDGVRLSGIISGNHHSGGIAGYNEGTIINSSADVQIFNDNDIAGGIVGFNSPDGVVQETFALGEVNTVGTNAGGIAGINEGTIKDVYARNVVEADENAGGITGTNTGSGAIEKAFATGSIIANTQAGGLMGINNGVVEDSYWDDVSTGQSISPAGTGLNTSQMQLTRSQCSMEGLDYDNTWYVTAQYPRLQWERTPRGYRTDGSGDWMNTSNWEQNTGNGWEPATSPPYSSTADSIILRNNDSLNLDTTIVMFGELDFDGGKAQTADNDTLFLGPDAQLKNESSGSYLAGNTALTRCDPKGGENFGNTGANFDNNLSATGPLNMIRIIDVANTTPAQKGSEEGIDHIWYLDGNPDEKGKLTLEWIGDNDHTHDFSNDSAIVWHSNSASSGPGSWKHLCNSEQDALAGASDDKRKVAIEPEDSFSYYTVSAGEEPGIEIVGRDTLCAFTSGHDYSGQNIRSDIDNFTWSVAGGAITGNNHDSIIASWDSAGTKYVKLTVTDYDLPAHCRDYTDTLEVRAEPRPTPEISGPDTVCSHSGNHQYNVSDLSEHDYAWKVTGGNIIQDNENEIQVHWNTEGSGVVEVTMTDISTANNCDSTVHKEVKIEPKPAPEIVGASTVCEYSENHKYEVQNLDEHDYEWSVTGGNITSDQDNEITVNWDSSGSGKVEVTKTNLGTKNYCDTSISKNVTILPKPKPEIFGQEEVCAYSYGHDYSVTKVSGHEYTWEVKGGTITEKDNNTIEVEWGEADTGEIILTQKDTTEDISCESTVQQEVAIIENPAPSITGDPDACPYTEKIYSTTFHDNHQYDWEVNGGAIINEEEGEVTVEWETADSGTIELTETNMVTECSSSEQATVYIFNLPKSGFTINKLPGIAGIAPEPEDTTLKEYYWDFGNGQESEEVTPVYQYDSNATYEVTLAVTNKNGCQDTSTQNVEISTVNLEATSGKLSFEAEVYPNPVRDHLNIELTLERPGDVQVVLYDMSGRKISSLLEKVTLEAGDHLLKKSLREKQVPGGSHLLQVKIDEAVRFFRLQYSE